MASIQKIEGKRGTSYRIIVSDGYDQNYKKIRHIKNWRVPAGWSEKRAEKEVQKLAVEFENQIKQGFQIDTRKTFAEYAAYVIDLKESCGVKHNTILSYRYLLSRINPKIGHMKLVDIRPFHLNQLYRTLSETGVRSMEKKVCTKADLGVLLTEHGISRERLAQMAGISHTTVTSACRGQKIMLDRAEKIAAVLGKRVDELFVSEQKTVQLSPKTVKEFHRFIRVVLAQAEKEMLVPCNAADRATPLKTYQRSQLFLAISDCGYSDGTGRGTASLAYHHASFARDWLPHINPHAFRHTVASILISSELDIVTVPKQLGHTKVSMHTAVASGHGCGAQRPLCGLTATPI